MRVARDQPDGADDHSRSDEPETTSAVPDTSRGSKLPMYLKPSDFVPESIRYVMSIVTRASERPSISSNVSS